MQVSKPKKGYKLVETGFGKYDEIPKDWFVGTLDGICKIIMGQSPKGSTYNKIGSGLPLINGAADMGKKFPNPKTWTTKPSKISQIGDIIIGIRASLGDVNLSNDQYCLGRGVAALRTTKKSDNGFLFHFAHTLENRFRKISAGSTIKGITKPELRSIVVAIPDSISEQQKIASILSKIDNTLEKTNQLIQKTELLKKGLLQKLLTKGIRHSKFKKTKIGEIPEEWEIKKIKDVSTLLVPLRDKPKKFEGDIPWLTLKDFDGMYVSKSKMNNNVTLQMVKKMNLTIFPVGTVICSISATIGICSITTVELITNQRFIGVVPNAVIDKEFLYYFLNTQKENILRVGTGSIHSYTSKDEFSKLQIVIPPLSEQKQIVDILSNVDSQIQKEKLNKSNLEHLKKGMMQKLLTGQIRVKV